MLSGPNSIGFVWSGVGQVLMRFMQLLVVFAMSAFLAMLVILCDTADPPPRKSKKVGFKWWWWGGGGVPGRPDQKFIGGCAYWTK